MSTTTPLRSSPERERSIAIALQAAAKEIAASVVTCMSTCVNCYNFDGTGEVCMLYKVRPPAKVIAYGCENFDSMPF